MPNLHTHRFFTENKLLADIRFTFNCTQLEVCTMFARCSPAAFRLGLGFLAEFLVVLQPHQRIGVFQANKYAQEVLVSIAAVRRNNLGLPVAFRQVFDLLCCQPGVGGFCVDPLDIFWFHPKGTALHQPHQLRVFMTIAHRIFLLGFLHSPVWQSLGSHAFVECRIHSMNLVTGNHFPVRILAADQQVFQTDIQLSVHQCIVYTAELTPEQKRFAQCHR